MSYSVAIGDFERTVIYEWAAYFRFHLLNGLTGSASAVLLENLLKAYEMRSGVPAVFFRDVDDLRRQALDHPRHKWRCLL